MRELVERPTAIGVVCRRVLTLDDEGIKGISQSQQSVAKFSDFGRPGRAESVLELTDQLGIIDTRIILSVSLRISGSIGVHDGKDVE